MDQNSSKKDFSLNKFYEKQDWIEKRYFNLIKYQFSGRIGSGTNNVMAERLIVKKNSVINDNSTIKFRKIAKKNTLNNTNIKDIDIELSLHDNNINKLNIKLSTISSNNADLIINFEDYIKKYIQEPSEQPANEPVIVEDANTKSYEGNDLLLDQNTVSYISFNFLNIKNIKEYRNKMNYIANKILDKYYKEEVKSIDKIKFNLDSLQIIQFDKLLRYNRGKNRLVLDNRVITPRNIGLNYRDIKRLRDSYVIFLEKTLKYKQTLNQKIQQKNYSLNVTNNELLAVLNNNPFNTKSKYLAQIEKIENIDSTKSLYDKLTLDSNKKIVGLKIKTKSYKKSKKQPLFVKFGTTLNIDGFSINPERVYIVHYIKNDQFLKPESIYLEQSLLETDNDGNTIDLTVPNTEQKLLTPINLFDCTNTFRKETIGVSNLIEIVSTTQFKVIFDNIPLEFKPLFSDDDTSASNNMYIDRPTYVMLNYTKTPDKNNIKNNIYENVLYKVIEIQSTSSNSSAYLKLESLVQVNYAEGSDENNIFKEILVSQYINSKNYIENVFFKKVDIPRNERVLSNGPVFKFVVELKNQIINITPEITRADIIGNYEVTMNKIIDYIYQNEAQKIHYEIPENIGVYKDTSSAVYSYKYKNDLYISYEKRNNPVNLFKNYSSEFLCKKVYRGSNFAVNMNSLYYLDSYQEYYQYFINLFKNTLGLHDEINYQCNEYYKSGSMLSNLKLPVTFNKYVTFSNNYMLYYKTNIKIDDIHPKYLGKHIVINNTVCDNQLLNVQNSNRNNSRLYKTFMKDLIYKHEIGRQGFEYSDAKKICERIFTVYDKDCMQKTYKQQSSNKDDYNVEYFKHNKERDNCFTTLYNDEKEKNTYQFIAESKMLDPTTNTTSVNKLRTASENIKKMKNTCNSKLTEQDCNADYNCFYNNSYYDPNSKTTIGKCETLIDSSLPRIYNNSNSKEVTDDDGVTNLVLDVVEPFEVKYDSNNDGIKITDNNNIIKTTSFSTKKICIFTNDIEYQPDNIIKPINSRDTLSINTASQFIFNTNANANSPALPDEMFVYSTKPITFEENNGSNITIKKYEIFKFKKSNSVYELHKYTNGTYEKQTPKVPADAPAAPAPASGASTITGGDGEEISSLSLSVFSSSAPTFTNTKIIYLPTNINISNNTITITNHNININHSVIAYFNQDITFITSNNNIIVTIKAYEKVILTALNTTTVTLMQYVNDMWIRQTPNQSEPVNFKGLWKFDFKIEAYTNVDVFQFDDNDNLKICLDHVKNNTISSGNKHLTIVNSIKPNTKVYFEDYIFKSRSVLTSTQKYFINDFKVKSKNLYFTGNGTEYFSISEEKDTTDSSFVPISLKKNINYINSFKSIQKLSNNENNSVTNYKDVVKQIEQTGNLRFYPHRLGSFK